MIHKIETNNIMHKNVSQKITQNETHKNDQCKYITKMFHKMIRQKNVLQNETRKIDLSI